MKVVQRPWYQPCPRAGEPAEPDRPVLLGQAGQFPHGRINLVDHDGRASQHDPPGVGELYPVVRDWCAALSLAAAVTGWPGWRSILRAEDGRRAGGW
ncbi:hypothetical protein [Actinopolymorpha pittospori]